MMNTRSILEQLTDSSCVDILISYDYDRYYAVLISDNLSSLYVSGPYVWDDEQSLDGHFEAPDQIYPGLRFTNVGNFADYLERRL